MISDGEIELYYDKVKEKKKGIDGEEVKDGEEGKEGKEEEEDRVRKISTLLRFERTTSDSSRYKVNGNLIKVKDWSQNIKKA